MPTQAQLPQKAIIDTATKVIKRLTIDANPPFSSNETVVVLPAPISLNGFTILNDDNTTSPADPKAVQQAGLDESFNAQQRKTNFANLSNTLDNIIADPLVTPSLQAFANALKLFLTQR